MKLLIIFFYSMQPEKREFYQNNKFSQQNNYERKKLPKHVFAFLNSILFDNDIKQEKDRLSSNISALNNELKQVKLIECVDLLDSIINSKEKLTRTISICHLVIERCLEFKIRPVLCNAYISVMKKHKSQQDGLLNKQKLQKLAFELTFTNLAYFYEAFNIQLEDKLVDKAVIILCQSNQFNLAFKIVRQHNNKKFLVDIIAQSALQCEDPQTVSLIIEQISNMGYGKTQYKKLHEKGLRQQMKNICLDEGYIHAEEVYRYNPVLLKLIANMMVNDKNVKRKSFLSFCARNPLVIQSLKDPNIVKQIQTLQKIEKNPLQNDIFGPSDSKKYLSLPELGVKQDSVIFVNSGFPQLKNYLQDIVQSKVLGLDTQSYVARTKFCSDLELIATIQISNGKKAYVFDAKDINDPQIGNQLSKFFCDPNKILIGHTLKQDLQATLRALGITAKYQCQCIDVKLIFKQLYPNQRAGLQNICQVVLGKPICKEYTLTDWGRRPLLKNQLHYAALDAVCVLHVQEKLRQKMKKK